MTVWDLTPRPPLHEWRGGVQRACPPDSSADAQEPVGLNTPSPFVERGAGGEVRFRLLFILLLALLPLIGHGCHGDDIDHEPSTKPPVYNQP